MSRKARVKSESGIYHIIMRGIKCLYIGVNPNTCRVDFIVMWVTGINRGIVLKA